MLATNTFAEACEIGERKAVLWQQQAVETGDPTLFRRWNRGEEISSLQSPISRMKRDWRLEIC